MSLKSELWRGDVLSTVHWCSWCEKIVTNVGWCPESDLSPCHSGQILSCDTGLTENYDWHYRGYLEPLGTRGHSPALTISRHLSPPCLAPSLITSHHSGVTKVETRSLCHFTRFLAPIVVSVVSQIYLSSFSSNCRSLKYFVLLKLKFTTAHWRDWGVGTCVILTHLKLTLDWHEYLFSYKRCKSFPQLNCDADKSCHNKQYLWLRRLWAIVALVAVTKKIKLNEWIFNNTTYNWAICRNKGFVSSLMENPFAN